MNTSVYHNELLNIYHKTADNLNSSLFNKVYNMINVAMVVKGIRPGAILASISETNKASVVASLEALGCFVKDIRTTKTGDPLLLIVREDNPSKRNLLASMNTALNANNAPELDPLLINQSPSRNLPHETIGTLLGYFNALSRKKFSEETKSVGIKVNILVNGTSVDIKLIPQKIKVLDTTRKQTLLHMAEQIQSLDLPDGFEIQTVMPFFFSNGVSRPLQPNAPSRLTGGKRRHTRKIRGRRQTRSRSSRR